MGFWHTVLAVVVGNVLFCVLLCTLALGQYLYGRWEVMRGRDPIEKTVAKLDPDRGQPHAAEGQASSV